MERACDILITFEKEIDSNLKQIKYICDRVILQNMFDKEDESSIAVEATGIVWSSTVDADHVDEDDVKDTLYVEFEDENVITDVSFRYYDFELEDKIDFAIETGMLFEDFEEDYSDDDDD